jgi:hypothetical protein
VTAFPDLSAARLTREVRALGYAGAYTGDCQEFRARLGGST